MTLTTDTYLTSLAHLVLIQPTLRPKAAIVSKKKYRLFSFLPIQKPT